jgi:hypothetical protein
VNLYFFKLAKVMSVNEERSEGHSKMEPSWIASHICAELAQLWNGNDCAYCLSAPF